MKNAKKRREGRGKNKDEQEQKSVKMCLLVVEEWKTNLMSLAILFHFLCAQHVSDINISIIRSLRLCCWITTSVVLFSNRCVLEIWCGWFWVVLVLQAEAYVLNMFRTLIYRSSGTCDCVVELPHRSSCSQFVVCWRFGPAGFEWCSCCRLKLMCSTCLGH